MSELYSQYKDRLLDDYFAFLRMPSISADPAHAEDMVECAEWVAKYMRESGLEVEMWETSGPPVVYGTWLMAGIDKPTLLIYGHYDVQPVDPLEEWQSPPFEPTVRDGEVYARGAQDNKGQILYTLCAIRALLKRDGKLPFNLKITVEGEEETKSIGFSEILKSKREDLKADYIVSPDMDIPSLDQPSVTAGMRGMAGITLELTGSNTDLHSGMAGGVVYNPNHALVEMLAKLRNPDGSVAIPGFYDDVEEFNDSNISLDLDPQTWKKQFGAEMTGGEKSFTPGQSAKTRPTCEINGISGGYSGPGFKTVIPAKAMAKISCRLVIKQDPQKILASLKAFLRENCPEGMEMEITDHGGGRAVRSTTDHPVAQAIAKAYESVFQKPCQFSLGGGSVPIMADLSEVAEATPFLMGVGLPDDQIHAPNEHFGIDRLELGFRTIIEFIQNLGE